MNQSSALATLKRIVPVLLMFVLLFATMYLLVEDAMEDRTSVTDAQRLLYTVGFSLLIAGLGTLWFGTQRRAFDTGTPIGPSFFPIVSALIAFIGMGLAYVWLGMWPIGSKTGMIVDMHHQYAPLLAELRETLLTGDSLLYSFEVGLGASYLPLIGYYCASPFNVLLLLFPESLLPEALLLVTLLKNMLTAALFTLAVQYIYGKRNYATVAVGLMFSMCMYLLAYSWNIMWLDCVMMLPLVVMGFERLMREGKWLTYILALAYTVYSNYYIGFMVCLFMVLYFGAYCLRERRRMSEMAGSFLRFALGSLSGGMIAMFMLVPVVLALGNTSAAGGDFRDFATNFDFFELLGRHLYDTTPTIRSGNLPNIYCGVLAVFLVPLFATTKSIRPRRRAAYMGLLGLLAVSMVINNFDLLWHGLHAPNDLPYRFSFLYSFFLLIIAYETLLHIREISWKQIGLSLFGVIVYLVVESKFGSSNYSFDSIYISLALILVYALILLLASRRKLLKSASYALLLCVVTFEMVTNASGTFVTLNSKEYFTAHEHYVDNATTETIREAVAQMEKYGEAEAEGGFWRQEFLPRRTSVDTALFDYRGITVFASSNSYDETRFMGGLGYAVNGVNSHLFRYFVPASDSLLGIRYVAMTDAYNPSPYLKERATVKTGSEKYTIYENTQALPLGYVVNNSAKMWNYSYYSPFVSQNSLLSAMTGNQSETYEFQQITTEDSTASVTGAYSFSIAGSRTTTFKAQIEKAGRVYVHVDCRAAKSISVNASISDPTTLDEDGLPRVYANNWSVTTYEPYVVDAGTLQKGDTVSVSINTEMSCSGNIYVTVLNEDTLEDHLDTLRSNGLQVKEFSDTYVEATVDSDRAGAVFTSIPFDTGWTVKVDGQEVETYAIGEAMLSFDITPGTHTITMSFTPTGFIPGLLLTLLGIALAVVLCLSKPLTAATATGEGMPFELPDDDDEEDGSATETVAEEADGATDEEEKTVDGDAESAPEEEAAEPAEEKPTAPVDPLASIPSTLEELLADPEEPASVPPVEEETE